MLPIRGKRIAYHSHAVDAAQAFGVRCEQPPPVSKCGRQRSESGKAHGGGDVRHLVLVANLTNVAVPAFGGLGSAVDSEPSQTPSGLGGFGIPERKQAPVT